jgi:hypothetical protein
MPLPSFASALLPSLRRRAAIALAASAAFGTHLAPAFAQDEPPDDGDDAVEIVGWDLSDPVNRAESREFFAGLWAAEDAGLPPPAFEFTNTPPGLMLAMLLPELEVFTEIYGHRLQLDFDAGERYLVTDLIADDAEVRAEFRAFVLTGKLAPRPEVDADAYLSHLDLVVDAMTVQQRASIESVESLGMLVESEGLSVEEATPAETVDEEPPPAVAPSDPQKECWLKHVVRSSRLSKCLKDLYDRTRQFGPPDMDCDDFADAFIRYLLKVMPPGWNPHYGVVFWECKERMPDGSTRWVGDGHIVTVFRDPQGQWWWVDPRRGKVRGPESSLARILTALSRSHSGGRDCRARTPQILPISDDILFGVHPAESRPWWQNPARRCAFCAALQACCAQPLPNNIHCSPPLWAPPLPSGCDILHYLPDPLPAWDETWGPLENCIVGGPQ